VILETARQRNQATEEHLAQRSVDSEKESAKERHKKRSEAESQPSLVKQWGWSNHCVKKKKYQERTTKERHILLHITRSEAELVFVNITPCQ
jgi:hypothetical protein